MKTDDDSWIQLDMVVQKLIGMPKKRYGKVLHSST